MKKYTFSNAGPFFMLIWSGGWVVLPCRFLFPCPTGDCFSACPTEATAQPLEAGCLLAAMPLRDSSCPVGAVPPYGWVPCGGTDFPFVGKWDVFTLQLVFCLPGGGQNHFFFCSAKEKAVLDSEKEKVDQWKSWGGAVQPDVGFVLLWYPSGEGLWGIPFGSGGLRLSDPWSLLRHCR